MVSFAATKKLVQQYGTAGIVAYGCVTIVSVSSIYGGLRSGVDILYPIETCLGNESQVVQTLKSKLDPHNTNNNSGNDDGTTTTTTNNNNNNNSGRMFTNINWVREGTYFGIATALDSLVLPLKLVVCLPLARQLIKIRGIRGGGRR